MKANFTQNEIIRLKWAFKCRDKAEKIISEARAKVKGKNKTHALRRLLGLCPECGVEIHSGGFYCDGCRVLMTLRHRKTIKAIGGSGS